MGKSVTFKLNKPVDDWVGAPHPASEPPPPIAAGRTKRLTIDVPLTLHTRVKTGCAARGIKICDYVRKLLEREFPP